MSQPQKKASWAVTGMLFVIVMMLFCAYGIGTLMSDQRCMNNSLRH